MLQPPMGKAARREANLVAPSYPCCAFCITIQVICKQLCVGGTHYSYYLEVEPMDAPMHACSRRGVKPWRLIMCATFCMLFATTGAATPPDPPVRLTIALNFEKPLEQLLQQGLLRFPVLVFTTADYVKATKPQFLTTLKIRVNIGFIAVDSVRDLRQVVDRELKLSAMQLRESTDVTFAPLKGIQKLEFSIQTADGGIIDMKVLYLQESGPGRYLLYTPKQFRRMEHERRWQMFNEALRKSPQEPDLRLLMPSTAVIKGHKIPEIQKSEQALEVRPMPPTDGLRPYFIDRSAYNWEPKDPLTVRGRLVYQDFDGVWRSIINASVDIWDSDTGPDEYLGTVGTDWNGYWSFSCNNDDGWWADGRDIYYSFRLENTRWRVQDCGPWPDATYSWESSVRDDVSDGSVIDFGVETGSTDADAMVIWNFLNRAWNHAVSTGGQDPGFIDCCFPESETQWTNFWEELDVEAQYADGPDVVTHEYAHGMMYYAYDGDIPGPGGNHTFTDASQDRGLAWSEGWGTGFALSVCPDGQFNWHEGNSEASGEYPSCSVQNDFGFALERCSVTCTLGEESEARVAAAINDLRDLPNDSSSGDASLGRTDRADLNRNVRVPLTTIWRDVVWGGYHSTFNEFWRDLAGELSGDQLKYAREACQFNYMDIKDPITCVVSAFLGENLPALEHVRLFRDIVLKRMPAGSKLIASYNRHSPEMRTLLFRDSEAREKALEIMKYFGSKAKRLLDNTTAEALAREDVIGAEIRPAIDTVLARLERSGSPALRKDVREVKALYKSVSGFTMEGLRNRLEAKKELKDRRTLKPAPSRHGNL